MNDRKRRVDNDEFSDIREMLRDALPALSQPELRRDLWPQMLRRMEERDTPALMRVPWFDWALLAVAGAALVFYPGLIPALLYHM